MTVHIMSTLTIKLHEILLSGFRGVAVTNRFSILISMLKGDKIINSIEYANLYCMSFIATKFQGNLLSGFRGVVLTNCFSTIFNF